MGCGRFCRPAAKEDVTPIVGAELSEPGSQRRVVCLVENDDGYRNLCRLITRRHCKKDFSLESDVPELGGRAYVLVPGAELLAPLHEAGVTVAAALPRRPSPSAAKRAPRPGGSAFPRSRCLPVSFWFPMIMRCTGSCAPSPATPVFRA
jgi:hypothetical protein